MSSTPAARPPTPTGAHEHSYQDTFTKQLAELHKFISANSDRNPAGRGDARIDQTFKPDRSSTLRMEVKVEDIKQTLYEISNGLKPSSEKSQIPRMASPSRCY